MSSRPPLGVVQQRQPHQRSLSGSGGLSQRPAHPARSLSQQFLPQSPVRKDNPFLDAQQPDGTDGAAARYGTQRRGGSRLKLELSHDPADGTGSHMLIPHSPGAFDSSKPVTPSRVMLATETSDLGDMSPALASTRTQTADTDSVPLPMPLRRARFANPVPRSKASVVAVPAGKKDIRSKPYAIETPAAAPRYTVPGKTEPQTKPTPAGQSASAGAASTNTGHADFYPWRGDHPEDQFSENVIRQGFFDNIKAPIAQTETSSAKAALFTVLKHKSGLHALSTVFTGVLGQRRYNGQITVASSFKPPPRVTLTDTKREAWLKDLANSAISLRRLSRTIPHGIRGKILLDQCLNKNVPVDRAIWLTKCVGANEIRSFKRKGVNGTFVMGGEAKWIRDWTVFVEQFVETVFSAFGDPEWKSKVNYAIRLASHLYAEQLLDRDHYMEWLVSSLENSPQSKLPMWMLIIQIYWRDLLHMRKTGRRLVTALLSHLHVVQNNPDKDVLEPLTSSLVSRISIVMMTSPENFISPTSWFKHRETLLASLPADDEALQDAYKKINLRNEQVLSSCNRSKPATRQILVRLLDKTLQTFMPGDLPAQCWNLARDKQSLARTLLEWCTSIHRPGFAKIYVASRVLQSWSTLGVDVTGSVLDFLDSDDLTELDRRSTLYHLVCELVRCGILSVPNYLQWLIARGGINNERDVSTQASCGAQLLVELPTYSFTQSQKNLRNGMLRRASYSVEDETADIEMAIKCLRYALGMAMDPADPMLQRKPMPISKLSKRICLSSYALKYEVGWWLRSNVLSNLELVSKHEARGPEMSPSNFNDIRTIFEAAGDFSMLAEALKAISKVSNVEILASCADTVNKHLPVFAALGVGQELFDLLHGRLKSIAEELGIGARPLLASLASLAPRIPDIRSLAAQLRDNLAQTDRNNPVDACSPVSDNMGARLQDDDSDLQEEIEKHLMSGTVIDRNTLDRFFQLVVTRLQISWSKATDMQRAYSLLLARLRVFDAQHFDSLMTKWLYQVRSMTDRPSILRIFPVLISVGCLSFQLILSSTWAENANLSANGRLSRPAASGPAAALQAAQSTYRTRYTQEVLKLVMVHPSPDALMVPEECYRLCILQDQAQRETGNEVLALIRQALAEYSFCRDKKDISGLPLDDLKTQDHLVSMLRSLILKDASAVSKTMAVRSSDASVGHWIDCLTTRLLIPTAEWSTQMTFEKLLDLTNEITLPFCQLKLSLTLAAGSSIGDMLSSSPDPAGGTDRLHSLLELFATAMDDAIDKGNIGWTGILVSLSPEITHHLKTRAQSRFLDLLPTSRHPQKHTLPEPESLQMAENLLSVIDAIVRGGSMGRPPQLVPAMVDKLTDLWEILASRTDPEGETSIAAKSAVINGWLPALLTFTTLHMANVDGSKASNEVRARALIVLVGIMQELELLLPLNSLPKAPASETDVADGANKASFGPGALADRVFDLACVLADNLADDARAMCTRAIVASIANNSSSTSSSSAPSDPRLRYLLGIAAPGRADSLALCHRDRAPQQPTPSPGGGRVPGAAVLPIPGGGLLGTPAALWGQGAAAGAASDKLTPFVLRRWEVLSEPTPNVGENDTAISLGLFEARKMG